MKKLALTLAIVLGLGMASYAEGGGLFGYDAVKKIAGLMIEAYQKPKDTKKIISHKGWGCDSCL